jgi:hypothetical protein
MIQTELEKTIAKLINGIMALSVIYFLGHLLFSLYR